MKKKNTELRVQFPQGSGESFRMTACVKAQSVPMAHSPKWLKAVLVLTR